MDIQITAKDIIDRQDRIAKTANFIVAGISAAQVI